MVVNIKKLVGVLCVSFIANANAFDVFHPIKSVEHGLVIGAVGYVATKTASEYLIAHPDKIENWLSTHPNEIDQLTKYVNHKIAEPKNDKEYAKYSKLKHDLALNSGVNNADSAAIENDHDWQALRRTVENEIAKTDNILIQNNQMPKNCSINVVTQLLEPKKIFETNVNILLPKTKNQTTLLFDVNSYDQLDSSYDKSVATIKLTHDHIPSYAALNTYFINHGVSMPVIRKASSLERNSSAISIPQTIHEKGSRTFGGRNNTKDTDGYKTSQTDAKNLLYATIKDITTIAYAFYKNPQSGISPISYIQNTMILYVRNKMLCMYDIK